MARSEMTTITTKEAAERAGLLPASFRGEMTRERARGRDHRAPRDLWPDGRTPLWDESSIRTWLEGRARSDRESSLPVVAEPDDDDPLFGAYGDDLLFGAYGDVVGVDDPASERSSTLMDLSASLTSTIMAAEDRLRSSTMRTNGWALRAVEAATRKTQKLAAHLDMLQRELQEGRE